MTDPSNPDPTFVNRVDAHIDLSNAQSQSVEAARVASSMVFAAARYSAWMCVNMHRDGQQMQAARDEAERLFVEEYRQMFLENYNDYVISFDKYQPSGVTTR